MDGEMLKNLFIPLIRPHQEISNVVWSLRFIKDRKLIKGIQKKSH